MKKYEYPEENIKVGESIGVEWKYVYKNNPMIPRPRGLLLSKVAENAFDLKPFPANCRDQDPTRLSNLMRRTIANSTITPITVMKHSGDGLYYAGDGNHLQMVAKNQREKSLLAYIMIGDLVLPEDVWKFFMYSYRLNIDKMSTIEKAIAVELAQKHYGYPKHFRKAISRDFMESEKDISSYKKIYIEMNKLPEVEKMKIIDNATRDKVGPETVLNRIQEVKDDNTPEDKKVLEVYEQIDRRVHNSISKFSTSLK